VEVSGEAEAPLFGYSGNITVPDLLEGAFESPSWDVRGLEFIAFRSGMGVIVDTVGPFDRNGGASSLTRTTRFIALLSERGGPGSQLLDLTLTDATEELWIDGVLAEPKPFYDWDAAIYEGHLRVTISWYLLAPFVSFFRDPGFRVQARLDDCDAGADDVIVGWVPEPAGLAFLALGAFVLLRRRTGGRG
jgi:hypothetical protein